MDMPSLLRFAKIVGASDVHMVALQPPVFRVNGVLQPVVDEPPLTADDVWESFNQISIGAEQDEFNRNLELDFALALPGVGRCRCNVAMQRGSLSMVIRLLTLKIPSLDDLRLPEVCRELSTRSRGLVIVSGPTGSGKSTTLAAMLDHLNSIESRRIVTIEDPIEYVYTNRKCTITQREVGGDTRSFATALRHVLRQDPDVILVGEMRDLETAAAVLNVAETGHLVLTTGHAPSSYQAIERVVDLFPPHERDMVQSRLASLLLGILCQVLVPRADGKGRVPAVEVMLCNPAVRNLIREGKVHQLPNAIRTHARLGMKMLDQSLIDLYRSRLIGYEHLLAFSNDREEMVKQFGSAEDSRSLVESGFQAKGN